MFKYDAKYWKMQAKTEPAVFFRFELDGKHVKAGKYSSIGILSPNQANLLRQCFNIISGESNVDISIPELVKELQG